MCVFNSVVMGNNVSVSLTTTITIFLTDDRLYGTGRTPLIFNIVATTSIPAKAIDNIAARHTVIVIIDRNNHSIL